ncbi:MAG: hypothetical protein ABIL67_03865 [candidate division WOR-3 bacterium]
MFPLPPFLEFFTYESSHFHIHYHKGVEDVVITVSEIADSIYEEYVKVFGYHPGKINLVVLDAYDFSNGFSTPIYENTIYIFLQNPFADFYFGFGSMKSWLELLISHELVHIFHLDYPHTFLDFPVAGIVRKTFGRVPSIFAFPNIFDPGWQIEGLAVYFESKGGYGRLNSGQYKNLLLAYVSGNRFSPDIMSSNPSVWQEGLIPYLWGGFFTKYLAEKYGEDYIIDRFVKSSYFEDPSCVLTLGFFPGSWILKDYEDFKSWREGLIKEAMEFKMPDSLITDYGYLKLSPTLSPSSKYLAFIENTTYDYPSIVIIDIGNGKEINRLKGLVLPNLSFEGDSVIYFAMYENHKNFFVFSDIYSWNFITGKTKRITMGERAFSPYKYGDTLFYVRRVGLKQEIVMRVGDKGEVLHTGKVYQGFNNLQYFNGKLFLSINDDGKYDIGYFDFEDGEIKRITNDEAVDIFSYADSSGVYFSRDEGKGYEVFVYKNGKFFKPNKRFFSVMYPKPFKGKVLGSYLTPKGYDVGISAVDFEMAEVPILYKQKEELPLYGLKPVSKPYNPLKHTIPKYWLPSTFAVLYDTLIIFESAVETSGGDVLFRHNYAYSLNLFSRISPSDTFLMFSQNLSYIFTGSYPFFSANIKLAYDTIPRFEVYPSFDFPVFKTRSLKGFSIVSGFSRDFWKLGVSAYYSSAFSYKKSGILAEGFTVYTEALYGNYGKEFYVGGRLALPLWNILLNFKGFAYKGLFDTLGYFVLLLPNIFKPNFPDINIGLIPPPYYHFSPLLFLSRIYPSAFYDGDFGFLLFGDFVVLGNTPITFGVGYSMYPNRGLRLVIRP